MTAVDTWNPTPAHNGKVLDGTQTDLCQHTGTFENGSITCR